MRDLNYDLKQLCYWNRDGSYRTQHDRKGQLTLIANQLVQLGFRGLRAKGLKPKHVEALVQRWKEEDITPGTMKNRMSVLRWWASRVYKPGLIRRDNDAYGIERRVYLTNESKAKDLTQDALNKVSNEYVRMSLILQRTFGLRREEAIKFRPSYADRGDKLVLKASWTKGGKQREVPIRNEDQRQALQLAHKLVRNGSLIPAHLKYSQQVKIYERQTAAVGLHRLHGLRHQYAQDRYLELTGWKAPAAGGPKRSELNEQQREQDAEVRQVISHELGHGRSQVTQIYLGR